MTYVDIYLTLLPQNHQLHYLPKLLHPSTCAVFMVIGASSKHFMAPLGSVIPLSLRAHRFKIMLQTICISIIDFYFSCIFFICILGWVKKLFSWTKRTFFVGSFGISSRHHGTFGTAAGIGCGWLWPQSALLGAGGGETTGSLGLGGFTLRTGDLFRDGAMGIHQW